MSAEPERDYAKALARVDPRWDAAQTERALAGLHRRRSRRRAATLLAACVALIAASVGGVWSLGQSADGAVAVADNATQRTEPDRVVRLADGSRVMPAEGAQVVVEHVADERIAVRVDRGGADFEVVPGLARRFEVRAGEVTVRVIGTVFRVERLADGRVAVAVERGHVDVAWAVGHADLFAGDEGTFPREQPTATETATETETELAATDTAATESAATETATTELENAEAAARRGRGAASAGEPSSWRALARAERYDEAYAALGGTADRAREVTDAVDDLLLAADVARLSGHPREALPWLEAVERDHASDSRAVLASFTRGRILMEVGRPAEAARQLERVLAMEPDGSLAEDALARAALAHQAAGNGTSAAELAARYLATHPSGRWSRRMSAIGASGSTLR
jgi:transmembrane sensor